MSNNSTGLQLQFQFLGSRRIRHARFYLEKYYVKFSGAEPSNIVGLYHLTVDEHNRAVLRVDARANPASYTAKYFSDNASNQQSLFYPNSTEADFVFFGHLEFRYNVPGDTHQNPVHSIRDLYLQGHSQPNQLFQVNIGGPRCYYIGDNNENSVNHDSSKENFQLAAYDIGDREFILKTQDDTIFISTPNDKINLARWMGSIHDDVKLNSIILPGSHDSGMSILRYCTLGATRANTQTQSLNIYEQLMQGTRYFDIRIDDYGFEELITYHRAIFGLGCSGESLQSIVKGLNDFFGNDGIHEAVIIAFSFRGNSHNAMVKTQHYLDEYLGNRYMFKSDLSDLPVTLSQLSLRDVRRKVICTYNLVNDDDTTTKDITNFRWDPYPNKGIAADSLKKSLQVYDKYSDTDDYVKMSLDQINKCIQSGGLNKNYLFLLSWTLTQRPLYSSIRDLASIAHKNLASAMDDLYALAAGNNSEPSSKLPNIIYIDYVDHYHNYYIIMMNQWYLEYTINKPEAISTQQQL